MVKIKLLLGLGTTAVVGGAGTAVYFGIQSGTDEKEKKKEDEKSKGQTQSEASSETPSQLKRTQTLSPTPST